MQKLPEHVPVLPEQVIAVLDPRPGHSFLDGTVGRGGHAGLIIPKIRPDGRYIGLDADSVNVQAARQLLAAPPTDRVDVIHANFRAALTVLDDLQIDRVDRLFVDLGFASNHVDDPARGFSFRTEGPLDMRFDRGQTTTAAHLVNQLDQRSLADLLWRYGEERLSRKIARKILERRRERPIQTTTDLARIVRAAFGPRGRRMGIDPATRSFMALRIAVNHELDALQELLNGVTTLVKPGGIAAVITFHSLEDRMVKLTFAKLEELGQARRLTRKPLIADEAERRQNPRSRSAKLRAIQMIDV